MSDEEFLLRGPDEAAPTPNVSLGKHLEQYMRSYGNKVALINGLTDEKLTYAEILTNSFSLAESLRLRGLKPGDNIGVCSENNLEFFIPVLGALFIGVTVSPLNPQYTTRELVHSLSISKPSIVFCSEPTVLRMEEARRQVSFLKDIVVFGRAGSHSHLPLASFLRNRCPDIQALDGGNHRVAGILCSSGTTGLAKGVMLTDRNILTTIGHTRDTRFGSLQPDDVSLGILPFFHSYGFASTLILFSMGLTLVILPKFEEETFLKSIQDYKVTLMTLVPPLVVFLAKSPLVSKYDLSSVRSVRCGAAPLGEDVQNLFTKRLNVSQIRQGYGMTETTLGVLLTPQECNKPGSCGVLAPGTECKVVDLVTGRALGPNKSGELCFRGPMMMKGYCGDLQATSASVDKDGFLHTGDVGYYDDDKYFYIVDRLKELIKYKGFQVPPAELEALLLAHASIKDAAVIGIPDEKAGELPLAFVVLQPGQHLTATDVIKYVDGHVSPQKRLRGGVRFVDVIPKNPSGKILRRHLRDSFKSKL